MASFFTPAPYPINDSRAPAQIPSFRAPLDGWMLAGLAIAVSAILAGLASTGVSLRYFLQPTGGVIVLGGTLGVILISTPRHSLRHALRRIAELFRPPAATREELIDDIVTYARMAGNSGLLAIEGKIAQARDPFLERVLRLALDVNDRAEFKTLLASMCSLRARQGESDAKVLETAGGFAPTIGVLGTVVGLIDVFRHFADLSAVATGVGTAFMSTIYGLALANLVLLPAAFRIRAAAEEASQRDELIVEGVLGLVDGVFPATLRDRLHAFLHRGGAL